MSIPNDTKRKFFESVFDLSSGGGTIKVALGGSGTAYTFDPDNHEFVADIFDGGTTAEELSDSSYSRQTLANQSTTTDTTDDEGVFDGDDTTFSSLDTTQDIQFIVVYVEKTDDSDSPVIAVFDDDSAGSVSDLPMATNGSDVTISWNSEGILNIT